VQLPLLYHVHCLGSKDQLLRTPKRLEAHHRISHSFHGPVVLLDDVVEIFGLSKFDLKAGVSIDTLDGGDIGTTFVGGDLLGQSVEIVGLKDYIEFRCLSIRSSS
jgi:hypothetical protein